MPVPWLAFRPLVLGRSTTSCIDDLPYKWSAQTRVGTSGKGQQLRGLEMMSLSLKNDALALGPALSSRIPAGNTVGYSGEMPCLASDPSTPSAFPRD